MPANPLSKLAKKADAVATRASVLLQRTYREVRGQLMDMAMGLNVTGSAEDREQVYNMVRRRFARLSRMIDQLTVDAVQEAARAATKTASDMTGVEIKYSARRAEAITELVTPAQGENLAAVFTDRMSRRMINALRQATVDTMREQAVEGGSLKGMTGELLGKWRQIAQDENPQFVDASGRTWDTRAYLSMNVRTNAMRVYNDCLVDAVARETGSDLMKISSNGSDSTCICAAWEGVIVSLTGATKGLPTYEDARNAGCFHPNCVHTLQVVDEYADKAEIELQKAHPVKEEEADDPDAADERKYEMDKDRYVRNKGMTEEQARVAVDRDNLTDNIRTGLLREDARQLVDGMTDAQVTALCPGGNPPRFEPFKPTKKEREAGAEEKWNHGSRGGVFHIARNSTLEHLLEVGKVLNAGGGADASKGVKSAQDNAWKPTTPLEIATDNLMKEIGAVHTTDPIDPATINPDYQLSRDARHWQDTPKRREAREKLRLRGLRNDAFTYNCQRCVPTWEAIKRGYKVTVLPYDGSASGTDLSWGLYVTSMWKDETRVPMRGRGMRAQVEAQMAQWGDGARCEVRVAWKGARGSGHVFVAEQVNGKTVFYDPQSNTVDYDPWSQIATRGRFANSHWILRTDNNEFTDVAKRCFTSSSSAQP